jgi:peptidoglycan biosynthesis protein MviN/MurJ (putative lipid II flippase)
MGRPSRWAYLAGGILIVMTCLLAVTTTFVVLEMLPRGIEYDTLLSIMLPLSILIPLATVTMAILLTKKRVIT